MLVYLLAFFGGVLTILSPCILPVLPFVFARSDQPFRRSGLPMLAGMATMFTLVAAVATLGGAWIVRANQFGRFAALALFAILGLMLLFPLLAERLTRPLVRLGSRLSSGRDSQNTSANLPSNPPSTPPSESPLGSAPRSGSLLRSFWIGVGIGLLWTPCAGPILGLILAGAALSGATAQTVLLLVVYAAGAALPLAIALLAGGRVLAAMKRSLGAEEWIRRILGVTVLAGVAIVAFGLDRGVLTRLSLASTSGLEQRLIAIARSAPPPDSALNPAGGDKSADPDAAQIPALLPELTGATAWINSGPLTSESLRGKVVLVDFWTYSCINCLRTLPTIRAWSAKYKDSGLVVIGVHAPEFPFEKDEANVRKAVADLGIQYPVAMDNDHRIWNRFHNEYWPAHYFIDANGRIRYHSFGEGNYDQSEQWIRTLLEERNHQKPPTTPTSMAATAAEAASDIKQIDSPETYIGYERALGFVSPGGFNNDVASRYRAPARLKLNEWALVGRWQAAGQIASLDAATGAILYRFRARDLHMVLGPDSQKRPLRFRVTLDGHAPGDDHGADTDAEGFGTVTDSRLYQLVRQKNGSRERLFRIEFETPGVQAFAFTFG